MMNQMYTLRQAARKLNMPYSTVWYHVKHLELGDRFPDGYRLNDQDLATIWQHRLTHGRRRQ